jgi:DNA-directed RNA polymerase specialized sigma24 family protein
MTATELGSLLKWLGRTEESAGDRYEAFRHLLIRLFEARGFGDRAGELTDNVLDIVARKLAKGDALPAENARAYLYGVARNVMREEWKKPAPESLSDSEDPNAPPNRSDPRDTRTYWERWIREQETRQTKEALLRCLEECLQKLPAETRALIMGYYEGDKRTKIDNRQRLAAELQITPNSLAIRVLRIRSKLEMCARSCMAE